MNPAGDQNRNNPAASLLNATLIKVGLGVGCLTLVIIFASLIFGLLLDRFFNTLPLFTIIFLVASMPLTWVAVFYVVNREKKRFISPVPPSQTPIDPSWEENDRD